MSVEIASGKKSLGQFASNRGYSELIAESAHDPVLKKFFGDGYAADIEAVKAVAASLTELAASPIDEEVANTAKGLAALIEGQSLVFITNGTFDDNADDHEHPAEAEADRVA